MKKAVIVASFGSASPTAVETGILPIEEAVAAAHPDAVLCRAFTSQTILNRVRAQGMHAESVEECISRLRCDGFAEITVVPALMVPGREYQKILSAAMDCRVARPLLGSDADIEWMAAFLSRIAFREPRPLLLMGHGSDGEADAVYAALREKLPEEIHLACFKGSLTLAQILPELEQLPEKKLTLMPLMLTAGRHALSDLAGDHEHSWKSILESRGFEIHVRMQGFGTFSEIRQRFAEKSLQ